MPGHEPENPTLCLPRDLSKAAVARFQRRLTDLLREEPGSIALDCSNIRHASSDWVSVLWQAHERCQAGESQIRLLEPTAGLLRTLEIMDLAHFFEVDGRGTPADAESPGDGDAFETTTGVYTDRFAADKLEIDSAITRFVTFLKRMHIPPTQQFELQTIFYEIATNVRRHAGLPRGARIHLTATATADKLAMTFSDPGPAFDPTLRDADIDFVQAARSGQKGGFGIPMIVRMSDRLAYERKDDTNLLTVEKERAQ